MRRVRQDELGAVAVEFALILPILLLLLIGIVEWSLAFKDDLSVTSATRTGARTASAEGRSPTFADDTARAMAVAVTALNGDSIKEMWIYKAGTDGKPDSGSFSGCSVCVRYTWDKASSSFVKAGGDWPSSSQNACAGESDTVGVYLKVDHSFLSGYFGPTVTITDHTVMKLEPVPSFQGCK